MEAIILTAALVHLSQLLACVWHYDVWVQFLLPLLYHFKFDVDDLYDTIEYHMVVEVELRVQVMFFFQVF